MSENNDTPKSPDANNPDKENRDFAKNAQQGLENSPGSKPANQPDSGNKNQQFRKKHYKKRYIKPVLKDKQSQPQVQPQSQPQVQPQVQTGNRPLQQSVRNQTASNFEQKRIIQSNQSVTVIIPLYNEEESLQELSNQLEKVFEMLGCHYEILFIDDGSTDRSFARIKDIHRRNNRFHCIKFRRNYGKSAALAVGFKSAKGDIIITMDADLQDDPNEIPDLIKVINSGYDLVSGWKKVRYDPFTKKHTSKIFNYVTSKVSGVRLHDFNCGLKAYKKAVVKSVRIYGELHRYVPALAHLAGFKVTEKVVKHQARKFGVTKFGANRFLNGFFDLLTVVFNEKYNKKPLHLFGTLGIFSFIAGFGITIWLTILKFAYGQFLTDRPLFLIGILCIIVGVQFFSLGLIAEMITKSAAPEDNVNIELTI